jgi:activator of 2-hydroxyglutaryl-CoA dehydratase/predicted nucleotide-binding protein (sugar kinase/HSP70/actin superfamily)
MNPEEAYKLERDKIIPASQDSLIKEDISSLPQNISTLKVESLQEDITRRKIFIDTGIEHIHVRIYDSFTENDSETLTKNIIIPNNDDIRKLFRKSGIIELLRNTGNSINNGTESIYITGKLSEITKKVLGRGESIMPAAVLWSAAKFLLRREKNRELETIGIIDLSASGYMVICIDKNEELKDDLLIVNPRCGAGTGINLSRILSKLDINKEDVDRVLVDYLGTERKAEREQVPVRSDRCGVFSSSATISDKNQGIPLDRALAITMKSEVMKPCRKMSRGTDKVYLTGGVFIWQYARNCAEDFLKANGVKEIVYDEEQSIIMTGMKYLVESIGKDNFRKQSAVRLRKPDTLLELPSFKTLKEKYEKQGLYERLPNPEIETVSSEIFMNLPVNIGLDIGSVMAKIVVNDDRTGKLLFQNFYDNHGDTINTIKHIFRKLKSRGIDKLRIQNIGITGSGRYQVQKTLKAIYPHIKERISVLVENYAHARGSIQLAKDHIAKLNRKGINEVNEDFCLLIDIGGEDTKISVISLKKEELFDNAMNIKCSAGTGSLMDTLKTLFNIENIAEAYGKAFKAQKAYGINATCAVFLMENARKMQAEGYSKDEILASCCYAIVENMSRSLWHQVKFPDNTIALLHGQTMLSDPLPLAVTHRAQEYTGSNTFCLVPPFPGHRACIGLVKSIEEKDLPEIEEYCYLDDLIDRKFDKKIIVCRGAACGDRNSRCVRTKLNSEDVHGKISLTLGGCTAVNELEARMKRGEKNEIPQAYKAIWKFIDEKLPKSEDKKRLAIPRSFAISEKAFFFGKVFEQFNIPVHIDNVQERDIMEGQPLFPIDTCAPNIGATGQFLRLAREQHGIILVPQIDFLPVKGNSVGRTCITNQGGVLIAHHFAKTKYPEARFKLFDISLNKTEPQNIADQLYDEFHSIFEYYEVNVSKSRFIKAIAYAAKEYEKLKKELEEITADFIEEAINKKLNISVICAREYVLNPGIYDSHIGKLLKDKGVVAIPAYVFETHPDRQFDYIYWKNPHDLITKVDAISNKRFHQIIKHTRLKELIKKIENGNTEILISVVTVSTFRCGPDSITLPVLAEITKNTPSLLIQSDAIIAELAHLENRINTHLNQLNKNLHNELTRKKKTNFSMGFLNEFSLDGLYKETDVIYFPTMNDNRAIVSVFRAAGLSVIDNYNDDSYDLEEKIKTGRKYVGDSVCAPLAAVFSDMLHAIDDYIRRKEADDPLVKGKERVVLFMHSGDGPCRQGQYKDICKLNFYKMLENSLNQTPNGRNIHFPIKFLVNIATELHDKDDYIPEVEKWITIQGFQAIILKGVLHSIYLKAGSNCRNYEEFEKLKLDFSKLKQTVYDILEHNIKPSKFARFIVDKIERKLPKLGGLAQYFGYGLFKNNRRILKEYNYKWLRIQKNKSDLKNRKVKIHVEGEVYLRVAQIEEILKFLIDTIGFGSFNLSYTPIWCYFEYIFESRITFANRDINMYQNKLKYADEKSEKNRLVNLIKEKKCHIRETTKTVNNLRNVLAKPLYKVSGMEIPRKMKKIIAEAKPVLPTFKPCGELVPYVGETISQLNEGTDLVLNVAPEGCMVSSLGAILTPKILQSVKNNKALIQYLFSTDGELNEDLLRLSLLKILGPAKYHSH